MWSLTELRQCKLFTRLFERVHPLCWPILWWSLNRLIRWIYATKPDDVLYETNCWGIITVRYVAPRTDPALYKPRARTFRPLSDPSWGSDLPSNIAEQATLRLAPILPRIRGGGGWPPRGQTEGAFTTLIPNTS